MRFRKETGDFSIVFGLDDEGNQNTSATISKDLTKEDLLGYIVKTNRGTVDTPNWEYENIVKCSGTNDGLLQCTTYSNAYEYNPETGAFSDAS